MVEHFCDFQIDATFHPCPNISDIFVEDEMNISIVIVFYNFFGRTCQNSADMHVPYLQYSMYPRGPYRAITRSEEMCGKFLLLIKN